MIFKAGFGTRQHKAPHPPPGHGITPTTSGGGHGGHHLARNWEEARAAHGQGQTELQIVPAQHAAITTTRGQSRSTRYSDPSLCHGNAATSSGGGYGRYHLARNDQEANITCVWGWIELQVVPAKYEVIITIQSQKGGNI